MNYIREIESFEDWLEINYLPATAQLLWYKLLVLCNRAGWAEWLSVTNQALMAKTGILSEKTFIETRNKLKQAGLIDFMSGKKGAPTRYKLFSVEEILQKIHCKKYTVKNTVNSTVNPTVNPTVKMTVNPTVNPTVKESQNADLSSLSEDTKHKHKHKHKHKQYNNSSSSSKDGSDWQKIQDAWENNIHPLTPMERENLLAWMDDLPAEVILIAINEAVKSNVRTMRYVDSILVNWHSNGILTKEAVISHLRERKEWQLKKQEKTREGKNAPATSGEEEPDWIKLVDWGDDGEQETST